MGSSGLIRAALAAGLLGALGNAACSSAADPEPSRSVRSIDYELFASTRQLTAAETDALSANDSDGTLRFDAPPDSLDGVAEGDVILCGISPKTPDGLLRLVLEVTRDSDGGLVLRTAAAPLQLAFRKLHARVSDVMTPFAASEKFRGTDVVPLGLKPQFSISGDLGDRQNYQVVVFDGDGNTETRNDQVLIDATLGGGFGYDLSIDVDWGTVERIPQLVTECITSVANLVEGELPSCKPQDLLPELKLGLGVEPHLEAEVAVSGAASVGFEQSFDIGTIALAPFAVGPLVIVPNADILATIAGSASARFSASARAKLSVKSRVLLSSKTENTELVPFELGDTDASADTPEVDLYAEVSAKPGVRFVLALYGALGPYAKVSAAATLRANPVEDPCWDFRIGLETELGVIVKTPSVPGIGSLTFLDWSTGPIPLWDASLADGSCDITDEGERVPPGGGPTAKLLQQPPFTPWARLLGLPADGSELASVLSYPTGFPFLTPSIDGRYVAGGAGALGLIKINGDGDATWQAQPRGRNDAPLSSLGSVPSGDAGIISLFRGGASAFELVKQGQSGARGRAITVDLPDECGAKVQALIENGSGGAIVVGECPFLQSAWLVEVDRDLKLVASHQLLDSDSSTVRLTPTALTRQDGAWLLAGQLTRTGEAAGSLGFLTRFSAQHEPTRSSAFACPERLSFYPTAAIPSAAGSVTLIGDAAGVGFVARVKADGSLGFARFPNLGGGVQSGFSPNSVVELPTTGLVLASTVDGVGDNPTDIIVLGLDGNGYTLWGREYTLLAGDGGLRAIGWPSARLTDDGGVLLTATAGPSGDSPGELLAMKVFARDGSLPDTSLISNEPITPDESPLAVEARQFEPTLAPLSATITDLP